MNGITALLVLGLALCACGMPSQRVVGGRDAPVGKYPYMVSFRTKGHNFCAGSIINKHYVLTAAHCIEGQKPYGFTLHVGTNFINETGTVLQPAKLIAHKGFSSILLHNDIGLIRVDGEIKFTSKVQPIRLSNKQDYPTGHPAILTGWGRLTALGKLPNNLQEIDLLVLGQSECRRTHIRVNGGNICTLTKTGEGACNGDSGGPLAADNVQIGVVSYGKPCALGAPDVYTRVSYFRKWIEENMKEA